MGPNWQTYWGLGIYALVSFIIFMEKGVRNDKFEDGIVWTVIAGFWPLVILFWAIEKVYYSIRNFLIFVYQKLTKKKVKHGK